MLVLSRRKDQTIMIGDDVEITIVDIQGGNVRLGITAPEHIPVDRKEVRESIKKEGRRTIRREGKENNNPKTFRCKSCDEVFKLKGAGANPTCPVCGEKYLEEGGQMKK